MKMGEFQSMKEQVQFFGSPPSFDDSVAKCREKFGWPLNLRGGFDCRKERAYCVLSAISPKYVDRLRPVSRSKSS